MFTIQYVHPITNQNGMQTFEGNRTKLTIYLSRFVHEILAVYEGSTIVTKDMQQKVAELGKILPMTAAARNFASPFTKTPA